MSDQLDRKPPAPAMNRRTFMTSAAAVAAAAALPSTLLAACGGSSSSHSGPTTVTFTFLTYSDISKDVQAVQNAINATSAMKGKSLVLKLDPIDSAAFDQKMQLRFASGQPVDIVFTASWANNFYTNVSQGNLLALDTLLSKNAPILSASMPKQVFDAGRVNGKLYGIPNQQLYPKYWGVIIRKDLAEKYQIDVSKLHAPADMTPILAQLKAGEPGVTPIYSDNANGISPYRNEIYGVDDVFTGIGVKINDPTLHAFNYYATPEYMQMAQLAYQWHQAGYFSKDALAPSDAVAAFKAGKYAILFDQARPEEPAKFKATYGWDEVQASFTHAFLNTESIAATMLGIGRSSQHPEQAMQVIEILNSDKTVYNLICHGIAGRDYTMADASKGLISVPATSNYNPNTDWMFGNQFNGYYTDPSEATANLWPVSAQLNKQALKSVALGYAFDSTPVKTQVAQVSAIITQYGPQIGSVDPSTNIPQFLSALQQAGMDDIVAEIQKQLTAWKATTK